MKLLIDIKHLWSIVKDISFDNDGDNLERQFGKQVVEKFSNCEEFWRLFIVPMTRRIDDKIDKTNTVRIRKRKNVTDDLYEIAIFHYSAFVKLGYAFDHLNNLKSSSFEEFYAHLSSCCDIVEEFFLKIYLLRNDCLDRGSEILQKLSKNKFLDLARIWYNENYHKVYTHYLNKGKFMAMRLPGRANLLDEYFEKSEDWKTYKTFTNKIRQYRNVLVHSAIVGKIWTHDGKKILVPKKEVIHKYKNLIDVLESANNVERLKHDFVDMREQMVKDINRFLDILNKLWNKPIKQIKQLFYLDKNEKLLSKYGLIINKYKHDAPIVDKSNRCHGSVDKNTDG